MIGKVIKDLLAKSTDLTDIVSANKIYPLIINEETDLPAIIYSVDREESQYDKDGWVKDMATFTVTAYSRDYAELQDIKQEVREALELKDGIVKGITIQRIYVTEQSEGFNITEDTFSGSVTFYTEIVNWE